MIYPFADPPFQLKEDAYSSNPRYYSARLGFLQFLYFPEMILPSAGLSAKIGMAHDRPNFVAPWIFPLAHMVCKALSVILHCFAFS